LAIWVTLRRRRRLFLCNPLEHCYAEDQVCFKARVSPQNPPKGASFMKRCPRVFVALVVTLCLVPQRGWAQGSKLPSPEEYLGHRVGADKKLVKYAKIEAYFRKAAEATDRVRIQELGLSSEGRKMILAVIAAPETLKDLQKHKQAQRKLADPR